MESYNTPDAEDVYEADPPEPKVAPVPVVVEGVVRTDEMPTSSTWRHVLLPAGGSAQKVLNADPRRKLSIIWTITLGAGCEGVMFGSMEDVQGNTGAVMLVGTGALRYETYDKGELYAKGILLDANGAGVFAGFDPSTSDAILSMAVEQWSD